MNLLRILVIDDDEDDFVVMRDTLSDIWGDNVQVDWASTYGEGLARLRTSTHDACFLDYRLGEKTGVDLLTEIGEGNRPPVILMTGSDEPSIDFEAMNAGAADYLVKGQSDTALIERSVRYSIARTEAEQQRHLAAIVELANEAIFQVNNDGTIQSWNAGAYRIFGLLPEAAIGNTLTCLSCEPSPVLESLKEVLTGNGDVALTEAEVVREDGSRIYVSIQVSPVEWEDGDPVGFSVIGRDVTASKLAELRRNDFVSIASHELRTPMTAILGFTELLLTRTVKPETQRDWLESVHGDGLRMAGIIDSLLNVSTIQSGRIKLELAAHHIRPVLDEVIANLEGRFPLHQFHLIIDGPVPEVFADLDKLTQVLANLVENAG
jgi:two-component system cell cycle sensor histidine kinase/response regulator CckA